jgi:hypothetical protein
MIIKQHNRNVEDHFVTTTLNKGRKHLEKEKKYFGATTFGFNVCFWGVSLLQSHSVYLKEFSRTVCSENSLSSYPLKTGPSTK